MDTNHHIVLFLRLGADADDAGGNGPGSYDVRGNVWHLGCCNPENRTENQGWMIFAAIFGWSNTGTLGQFRNLCFPFRSAQGARYFRHDPWICVLLDRCYGHFVRFEAKRYAICPGVPWVLSVNA